MTLRRPEDVLSASRLVIGKKTPYLLSATYALTPIPIEDGAVETSFVTPGMVMGYNPNFMAKLTDEEGAFVFLHEVLHPRLRFFEMLLQVGMENKENLNIAHDLTINVMLRDMGYPVFSWAEMPKKRGFAEGLSTPEYYELLQKQPKQKGGGGAGKICAGGCASPNKQLQEELDSLYGRSEAEKKSIERKTASDIAKYIQGSGRGSHPGWLTEWASIVDEKPETINWRDRLNHIIQTACGRIIIGGDDFSLRRPSKRSHVRRILRPGLIDHEIEVMFVVDTSGSMNPEMMMEGIHQSRTMLRQCSIDEAWYMEVDCDVAKPPQRVNLSFFDTPIEFRGRGGTSFVPAFIEAKKVYPKPDLLIYWTDGDGGAPDEPPENMHVIWALVPGRYSNKKPARWGDLVIIDDDPSKQQLFEESDPDYDEDEEQ